jgi:3-oxoadipate enol-lactonase / 4-carboxymuconolactone decarboxylase
MPYVEHSGARIHWRRDGDPSLPPLVLANSLGTDHHLWDPVMPRLADFFHVIRMDGRGHGASDAPPGEYDLALLARDLLAVADAAGIGRFDLVGVSLGGMIGQWLGLNAPGRLRRLVLCNTSARMVPAGMAARIAAVRDGGLASVADTVLGRFFTQRFIARGNAHYHSVRETLLALDPVGYAGACAAVRDMDLLDELPRIGVPTTVVVGRHDQSTPPAMGEAIAAAIPGATLVELDCAHLPHSEDPPRFIALLMAALEPQARAGREAPIAQQFDLGLERRRQALGAAYVDARIASADAFNGEFQDMITRWAWHDIWTRPVFDDRTRRLVVLAITAAMGRWEEYRLHLKAGLEHELSPTEVKELLQQAAIYAGVPAANTGFHHAAELLRALERERGGGGERDGERARDDTPQRP